MFNAKHTCAFIDLDVNRVGSLQEEKVVIRYKRYSHAEYDVEGDGVSLFGMSLVS